MPTFDEGPANYGIQTIDRRGRSNAGMGPYQKPGVGYFTQPTGLGMGQFVDPAQQEEQRRRQAMLQQQHQRAESFGQQNEQMVQQQMQNAAPVQNYVDTWQMTPEKIAAYRAQQQSGTSMQQQQPGIGNGQLSGQQAIANLLRMLGLG